MASQEDLAEALRVMERLGLATDKVLAEPADLRCKGTLGSKPWWMSEGQYDPCRCRLDNGHGGPHWCEHLDSPDPRNRHGIEPQ